MTTIDKNFIIRDYIYKDRIEGDIIYYCIESPTTTIKLEYLPIRNRSTLYMKHLSEDFWKKFPKINVKRVNLKKFATRLLYLLKEN